MNEFYLLRWLCFSRVMANLLCSLSNPQLLTSASHRVGLYEIFIDKQMNQSISQCLNALLWKASMRPTIRFLLKIYFLLTPQTRAVNPKQNKITSKMNVTQLQIGSGCCCCFSPIDTLFRQRFQVMALSSAEFNKAAGFPPTPPPLPCLFSIIRLTAGDHYPVKQRSISSALPLQGNRQRVRTNVCVVNLVF